MGRDNGLTSLCSVARAKHEEAPMQTRPGLAAALIASLAVACGGTTTPLPGNLTYSTNPAVYVAGTAISPNTPTVAESGLSFSVSPALPTGLGLDASSGAITGTPVVILAVASYTVTASNAGGSATAILQISVTGPYAGLNSVSIPFPTPINSATVPQVYLRMTGGVATAFGMDTGSTGICVSSQFFVPGPDDQDLGPGSTTYSSSGIIWSGEMYLTTVTILLKDATTTVATARVPVLRVTQQTCVSNPRDCTPNTNPTVHFMGVGFNAGKGFSASVVEAAAANPFTNLASMSGFPLATVRPGYVITKDGVNLGVSTAITQDMAFVKLPVNPLTPSGAAPLWLSAPATITAGASTGAGTMLVDTGVGEMLLSPAPGSGLVAGSDAPIGTTVGVYMPGQSTPQPASYSFTLTSSAGACSAVMPGKVLVVADPGVFVNTGRMFLNAFDYLYDAKGGYVGYRWNGTVSSACGQVTPTW
jgi:hypothetical protein